MTKRHDDGRACATGRDSLLCALIVHPATTVEDIESRRYGHAQFECAYALLETKSYAKLTAYLWCVLPHCPTATACVFPQWEEQRCTSEVHNLLGFAYSRSEDEYREKGYAHYHAALTLAPDNFGAWGYLAQLYVMEESDALARNALAALCAGAGPEAEQTQVVLADFAAAGWEAGECRRQLTPDLGFTTGSLSDGGVDQIMIA